jgi:recombination protein RecA
MATKKKSKTAGRAAELAAIINAELGVDIRVGSDPSYEIVRIPTGSLVFDRITGGGFALGRHYEIFGDESAGKSYIVYRTMANSQQRGKVCALIDPEHSYDRHWFARCGGDPDSLLLHQPENAEDAVAVMMTIAKNAEEVDLEVVGIDSVASLVPTEEIQNDPRKEDRIAGQARMMSRALRRITTVNRRTLFIWTNQERTDIGVRFGNPRTTTGGKALRFYATGRIEMRRGTRELGKRKVARAGKLVESEVQIGRWVQCRVIKDKSTRPYREGSFAFSAERNEIDLASEIIQLALEDGIFEPTARGLSYTDLDEHEWKGTVNQFRKWLNEHESLRDEIIPVIEENTQRERYGVDGTSSK